MERYFVIHNSEDGEVSIKTYTKEELEEQLNLGDGGDFGESPFFDSRTPETYNAANELDPQRPLIIFGKIIVPIKKEVVLKYEV